MDLRSNLTPWQAHNIAAVIRAVAEPSRLELISLLHCADRWMRLFELREELGGLCATAVMHHVEVLADAGVVVRQKRGHAVLVRLAPDALAELAATLLRLRGRR